MQNKRNIFVFVGLFALIGVATLLISKAATPSLSIEPESGQLSGAASIYPPSGSDANLSGGKAAAFGSAPSSGCSDANLLFCDDFNGSTIDATKWNIYSGTLGYDQGCYTTAQGPTNNLQVTNGMLIIRTKRETSSTCSTSRPFTTGYLKSDSTGASGSVDKYIVSPTSVPSGVISIEMRAQMPANALGIWPGLWSRNEWNGIETTAQPYGELDFIERWGDEPNNMIYQVGTWLGTKHTGGDSGYISPRWCPIPTGDTRLMNNCDDLTAGMHTYAVEIDSVKAEVRYYLDGRLVAKHTAATSPGFDATGWLNSIKGKWDLRIMNQVVKDGDAWHKVPDPAFQQAELKVDYVKVWKK